MKKYEILIIYNNIKEIDELKSKVEKIITHDKGVITESEDYGLRDFAYPIHKKDKGFYKLYIVECKYENIAELRRVQKINKDIVRLFIINIENEPNYVKNTKLSSIKVPEDLFARKRRPRFIKKYNNNPKPQINENKEENKEIKNVK